MTGGSPLYYWDTCLFLAWLKDEPTGELLRADPGRF